MFVRILRNSTDQLHECDSVFVQHNTDSPMIAYVHLEHRDDNPGEIIEFNKAETTIYIMNQDGRTINKHVWDHNDYATCVPHNAVLKRDQYDPNTDHVSLHTYANPTEWLGWIDIGSGENLKTWYINQNGEIQRFSHETGVVDVVLDLLDGSYKRDFN